ncbi:MAG TPA: hypothetical protein VF921_10540 [Vicinamibacterales bacterium]
MPAVVASPSALHAMTEPLMIPWAIPVAFRFPAHVALKDPLAEVAVCSVAFHLKSEQVDADGIALDAETQFPIKAATPPALGLVLVLECSKPAQPVAATATASADANM